MSERTHVSEPLEDDEPSPDVPLRRPSALPIARFGNVVSTSYTEAPREQVKTPREQLPLVIFERDSEAQVSVPAAHVPAHTLEAARQAAEQGRAESEEDDDDDEEPAPGSAVSAETAEANTLEESTHAERTPQTAEPSQVQPLEALEPVPQPQLMEAQQYAAPVIPNVPAPSAGSGELRQRGASEQIGGEGTTDAEGSAVDGDPEDPFERLMADAGFDPRFTEAVSGSQLGEDRETADVFGPAPSQEASTADPSSAADTSLSRPSANGGSPPVPPTRNYFNGYGQPSHGPNGPDGPTPNIAPRSAYAAANYDTQPQSGTGYTEDDLHRARQSGARQGVVAGAVAGGLAGRYFANRKARKEQRNMKKQHAKELGKFDAMRTQYEDRINRLQDGQEVRDAITARPAGVVGGVERPSAGVGPNMSSAFERPAFGTTPRRSAEAPVIAQQPEEATGAPELAEQPAADNPFEHQDAQPHHKVRSEWLEIGVDKTGKVVDQEYGRAFQEEVRQEQTGNRTFAGDPRAQQVDTQQGQPQGASFYIGGPIVQQPSQSQLDSGQVPMDQRLQAGRPTHQDPQHLLPPPQKQVVSNVANPWFWLMLAIIAVVYFAATLL